MRIGWSIAVAACSASPASGPAPAPACGSDPALPEVTPVVEGSAQTALCATPAYVPPTATCDWHCLVALHEGGSPQVVFAEQQGSGYWFQNLLAVTDDFVVATATFGSIPADTWEVVEVPVSGGAPVVVDTFGASAEIAGTLVGSDGYLYYAAWATSFTGPVELSRISLAELGDAPSVLATVPASQWGIDLVLDGGYLYAGGAGQISRVAAAGGPLESVLTVADGEFYDTGELAVYDGLVYAPIDGVLNVVPGSGGTPRSLGAPALEVMVGGCDAGLFVISPPDGSDPGAVSRFDADGGSAAVLVSSPADNFDFLGVAGDSLYLRELCPPPAPESPGGSFARAFDTATGAFGLLTDAPGYPFIAAPTGIAHDPAGTTLYYLE